MQSKGFDDTDLMRRISAPYYSFIEVFVIIFMIYLTLFCPDKMKKPVLLIRYTAFFFVIVLLCIPEISRGQVNGLPFYYEKNLPLNGQPSRVEEYYYEYHTQVKAHYYNHFIEYDSLGRVKKHVKTNVGLMDDIPLTFINIIDPRPVTITCSFEYDIHNRLTYFIRNQYQEEVGEWRQDEEWLYDRYHTLVEHNFREVSEEQKIIKNPSVRWRYGRKENGQVKRIEKLTYSFADRGLVLSEITEFGYRQNRLDTISVYQVLNERTILKEKRVDLSFQRYNDTNPDSMLLGAFYRISATGDTTFQSVMYDDQNRRLAALTTGVAGDTIAHTEWQYEEFSVTETSNGAYSREIYYDETGYERYREEFQNGYSLAVPADFHTRVLDNGRMQTALYEIWDPVTYFYRKDTEYLYFYDLITSLPQNTFMSDAIMVFPNPCSGTFYLDKPDDVAEISLYSTDGKTRELPVSFAITPECPKGIYLLVIKKRDNSVQRTRIVLE